MADKFELFAFYSNPKLLAELIEAGIDGIIVDWENQGKEYRQSLYNTQVNQHETNDLAVVKNKNPSRIICRINGPDYWSTAEINQAIDMGADELLLPMIRTPEEAEFVINHVNGQVEVGLMLETSEALEIADVLNDLPVNRFYVGLNDLSIQRRTRKLFLPFVDGTIDKL